jgi:predicted Zn-dependent protease
VFASATFPAYRFDGAVSAAAQVEVRVEGTMLILGDGTLAGQRWPLRQIRAGERFERTPRMVELPDGATLEVPDPHGQFDAALRAQGLLPGAVQRMQRHQFVAVLALALCAAFGYYAYVDGIPALARVVAMRIPMDVERRLGERFLADADRSLFRPTRLGETRRMQLDERFAAAARSAAPDVSYRVVWRRMGDSNRANALTLPGGTIVMLDGLEGKAANDEALVGVFGHELGHVAGRHTMRRLVQIIGVGALAHIVWGDISSLLLNGAVLLSSLDYSRDMEREADGFALDVLRSNHLSAEPLIEFLTAMEAEDATRKGNSVPGLLTTHPMTKERVERLRASIGR